jgi:hypothetical protein
MVHGLFRASGIVMIYRLHHDLADRKSASVQNARVISGEQGWATSGERRRNKRTIRLIYHHKSRILEPHDYGILNGSVQLLGYQIAGSSSRPLPNWLLMKAHEITDLELLDQTFPGGRPTASGKHRKWDKLFIRVKPAADHLQARSA